MKRIMAVCDVDPFYADRFAEFANEKGKTPFTAVAFGSMAKLHAFAKQHPVEILLAGDGVTEADLEDLKVGQVVRLSETGLKEKYKKEEGEIPVVYKYQSSEAVLREVMACYQVKPDQAPMMAVGLKSEVIGVCSPVNRCGKSGFCITLGQVMARDRKVLYLNLEEYSGLSRLTGIQYDSTLSDLIYDYRRGEYSRMRLSTVLYNWGELDYVPPAAYAEDLAELKGEELAALVAQIAEEGMYHVILLDLGQLCRGTEALLELCSIIYTPTKEDCVSAAKMEEWKQFLIRSGRGSVWERVHLLKLPMPGSVRQPGVYLEQLLWGEVGDYVRTLLKGGMGGRRS